MNVNLRAVSVFLGLGVFTLYYILLSLGMTFGESGKINSYVGLWLPNIIATLTTIYVIRKVTSEKWHSIAHGFELMIERLIGLVKTRGVK